MEIRSRVSHELKWITTSLKDIQILDDLIAWLKIEAIISSFNHPSFAEGLIVVLSNETRACVWALLASRRDETKSHWLISHWWDSKLSTVVDQKNMRSTVSSCSPMTSTKDYPWCTNHMRRLSLLLRRVRVLWIENNFTIKSDVQDKVEQSRVNEQLAQDK